jgi:hypothetical protein
MKKNRGDEPIGVVMHTYMEVSQGNCLCSYPYLKQAKNVIFFLFSSAVSKNRRVEQVMRWVGSVPVRVGRWWRKEGESDANTVYNVCKCKNDTCSNYLRNEGRGE